MDEFIRDADPRRHGPLTQAEWHLIDMMRDIKTLTGSFQDTLVAEFLNGVPGIRMTAEQLRKMRTRHAMRTTEWTPPHYGR